MEFILIVLLVLFLIRRGLRGVSKYIGGGSSNRKSSGKHSSSWSSNDYGCGCDDDY